MHTPPPDRTMGIRLNGRRSMLLVSVHSRMRATGCGVGTASRTGPPPRGPAISVPFRPVAPVIHRVQQGDGAVASKVVPSKNFREKRGIYAGLNSWLHVEHGAPHDV